MPPKTDEETKQSPSEVVGVELTKELREDMKHLKNKIIVLRSTIIAHGEKHSKGEALRCVALAYTEAQSSRHWLGEVLGALGEENPYKA